MCFLTERERTLEYLRVVVLGKVGSRCAARNCELTAAEVTVNKTLVALVLLIDTCLGCTALVVDRIVTYNTLTGVVGSVNKVIQTLDGVHIAAVVAGIRIRTVIAVIEVAEIQRFFPTVGDKTADVFVELLERIPVVLRAFVPRSGLRHVLEPSAFDFIVGHVVVVARVCPENVFGVAADGNRLVFLVRTIDGNAKIIVFVRTGIIIAARRTRNYRTEHGRSAGADNRQCQK